MLGCYPRAKARGRKRCITCARVLEVERGKAALLKWQAENPERYAEVQREAKRRYEAKKKAK